jgi:hypothetical protein
MRIGIFTQWYEPEPGPAALCSVAARALAKRGHEVHVLTGLEAILADQAHYPRDGWSRLRPGGDAE